MNDRAADAPIWTPSPERAARSRAAAFAALAGADDWGGLYDASLRDPGAFWSRVWEFTGLLGEQGATPLADGHRMPGARWFPEARLNFAENLLRRQDDAPAVLYRREDGARRELTFRELRAGTARLQRAFREAGLQPGDRVAAFLPNVPEAVTAMLAVTSLGGIWSSGSPDFAAGAVLDRFGQLEPRFLLATETYRYRGRVHDVRETLRALREGLGSLERVILVGEDGTLTDAASADAFAPATEEAASGPLRFPHFPFDHPVYILFSSGTTGKPKCIVHGAGGTLLQHLKEHQLHADLGPEDLLFYFTTTGWMMWNWLVSALASGCPIVLYDGHPFHPAPDALWRMAAEEGVTVFGTSAKYVDACRNKGLEPAARHDLGRLRALLSTGSPLAPESFDWLARVLPAGTQISSISGGTDLISCFALGSPLLPVYRGELQARGLGMKVEIWNEDGEAVVDRPGELVCAAPFPSMPVGFWNDPDGSRYRGAYFEHFPGVWRHGDWARLTAHGGLVIYGRSDTVLNPGGVRIGTAEIYRPVESIEEIEESIAVGQPWEGDERIVLFVKLRPGVRLDDPLRERVRRRVRERTSPRHVPAVILQVPDIPRTRSGKISESAVRDVVHGREVRNRSALANPESLAHFRDREELAT